MKLAIGSDHAGFGMKSFLIERLKNSGHNITDCGTHSAESTDYPDYAAEVCARINDGTVEYGILICGTGIGISIAANKIKGIRAALCHTEFSAKMARQHNNANVLALGANVLGEELALSIAETFIGEKFSLGERHIRRIGKITALENDDTGSC